MSRCPQTGTRKRNALRDIRFLCSLVGGLRSTPVRAKPSSPGRCAPPKPPERLLSEPGCASVPDVFSIMITSVFLPCPQVIFAMISIIFADCFQMSLKPARPHPRSSGTGMSAMKAKMRIYAKISRSKGLPARNQLQKSLKQGMMKSVKKVRNALRREGSSYGYRNSFQ